MVCKCQVVWVLTLFVSKQISVHPIKILDVYFKSIIYAKFDCALSCRN
jgi:hypothetical protein